MTAGFVSSVNGPVDGLQAGCAAIVMDVRSGKDTKRALISVGAEYANVLFHIGSETNITADSLSESVGVQTGSLSERAMGQVLTRSVQGLF